MTRLNSGKFENFKIENWTKILIPQESARLTESVPFFNSKNCSSKKVMTILDPRIQPTYEKEYSSDKNSPTSFQATVGQAFSRFLVFIGPLDNSSC